MTVSLDVVITELLNTGNPEITRKGLLQYRKEDITPVILSIFEEKLKAFVMNNNFDCISVIIDSLLNMRIPQLDITLIKSIYIHIAINNSELLERFWNELNLKERTFLLPQSALSTVLESIDVPTIFETILEHIQETDEYTGDECDIQEWILDTVLTHGTLECFKKTIQLYPDIIITEQNVYSCIMGGNVECLKYLNNINQHPFELDPHNILEYAIGYGGLEMFQFLQNYLQSNIPMNQQCIDKMFAYALAGGRIDTLTFIHDTLGCTNYNYALDYARQFNINREYEIEEVMGYEFDFHEKKWFISRDYPLLYEECVAQINDWNN